MENSIAVKSQIFELDINPIYAYDLIMYISNPLFNTKGFQFKGNKKSGLIQVLHKRCGKFCQLVCDEFKSEMTKLSFTLVVDISKEDEKKFGELAFERMKKNMLGLAFADYYRNEEGKTEILKENIIEFRNYQLHDFINWFFEQFQIFGYRNIDQGYSKDPLELKVKESNHFFFPIKKHDDDFATAINGILIELQLLFGNKKLVWNNSQETNNIVIKYPGNELFIKIIPYNEVLQVLDITLTGDFQIWDFWGKIRRQLLIKRLFTLPGLSDKDIEIIDYWCKGYTYDDIAKTLGIPFTTVRNTICETRKEYGVEVVPEDQNRNGLFICLYTKF